MWPMATILKNACLEDRIEAKNQAGFCKVQGMMVGLIQGVGNGSGEKMIDTLSSDFAFPTFFVCEIGYSICLPA